MLPLDVLQGDSSSFAPRTFAYPGHPSQSLAAGVRLSSHYPYAALRIHASQALYRER